MEPSVKWHCWFWGQASIVKTCLFFPPCLFELMWWKVLSLWALHYGLETAHLRDSLVGPVSSTAEVQHAELNLSLSKVVNLCVGNGLVLEGDMANTWGLVFPGLVYSVNISWLKFFMGEAENIDWNLKVWSLVLNTSAKLGKSPFSLIFIDVAAVSNRYLHVFMKDTFFKINFCFL